MESRRSPRIVDLDPLTDLAVIADGSLTGAAAQRFGLVEGAVRKVFGPRCIVKGQPEERIGKGQCTCERGDEEIGAVDPGAARVADDAAHGHGAGDAVGEDASRHIALGHHPTRPLGINPDRAGGDADIAYLVGGLHRDGVETGGVALCAGQGIVDLPIVAGERCRLPAFVNATRGVGQQQGKALQTASWARAGERRVKGCTVERNPPRLIGDPPVVARGDHIAVGRLGNGDAGGAAIGEEGDLRLGGGGLDVAHAINGYGFDRVLPFRDRQRCKPTVGTIGQLGGATVDTHLDRSDAGEAICRAAADDMHNGGAGATAQILVIDQRGDRTGRWVGVDGQGQPAAGGKLAAAVIDGLGVEPRPL